jgi:hypothetical protein
MANLAGPVTGWSIFVALNWAGLDADSGGKITRKMATRHTDTDLTIILRSGESPVVLYLVASQSRWSHHRIAASF